MDEKETQRRLMTLQENISDMIALMTPEEFAILMVNNKKLFLQVDARLTKEGKTTQ